MTAPSDNANPVTSRFSPVFKNVSNACSGVFFASTTSNFIIPSPFRDSLTGSSSVGSSSAGSFGSSDRCSGSASSGSSPVVSRPAACSKIAISSFNVSISASFSLMSDMPAFTSSVVLSASSTNERISVFLSSRACCFLAKSPLRSAILSM